MTNWNITRIEAVGIKGGVLDLRIDGPTLVVGPNGAGKSRVLDAVAFALGRPVAGVAAAGADLRAAVSGDECRVRLTLSDGEGRNRTLERNRKVDPKSGAFGLPKVSIDGIAATEAQVIAAFGEVSAPGGAVWLSMSRDKLIATVGAIGASTDDGRAAIDAVKSKLDGVVDLSTLPQGDPVAWLSEARKAAKAAANEATTAARAADNSAEISRQASAAGGNVTPDRLRNMEATRDSALTAHGDAVQAMEVARAKLATAENDRRKWENDVRAASSRLEGRTQAEAQARAVVHGFQAHALTAPDVPDLAAIQAQIDDVAAEIREAGEAVTATGWDVSAATRNSDEASNAHYIAQKAHGEALATLAVHAATVEKLREGCCPTCQRVVSDVVLAAFKATVVAPAEAVVAEKLAAVETTGAAMAAADAAHAEIATYYEALKAQKREAEHRHRELTMTKVRAESAHRDYERAQVDRAAASDRLNAAVAEMLTAREEVARLAAQEPKANADLVADFDACERDVELKRAALSMAQTAFDDAQQSAAKYARHVSDVRRRDAAQARKEMCDRALDAVRAAEESVAHHGVSKVAAEASRFLPLAFGRIDLVEGEIGLWIGERFICGAGLSGAQREALATAIDRALDVGRSLRVMLLEADALDGRSVEDVASSAVTSFHAGELGTVLIATCHEPEREIEGLNVVRIGGQTQPPGGPRGTKPDDATPMTVNVVDDAVGTFGGDDSAPLGYVLTGDIDPPAGPVEPVHVAVSPEAVDEALATNAPPPAPIVAPTPPPAPELRPQPAATAQPDLFGAKLPTWLAKPGRTMNALKPDPEHVAKVAAGLSSDAAHYMHDWPGRGAEPGPRLAGATFSVVDELIDAEVLTDDPLDCKLTPGGVEVWRLLHAVEPVRSDAQAIREDAPPVPGAGATEAQLADVLDAAKLSAEALRYLGLTRAGLDTATKRTAPIWRRHISRSLCVRGATVEDALRWTAEAAQKHPKKTKAAGQDGDADPGATDENEPVAQ